MKKCQKNIIIAVLSVIVIVLVGIVLVTNYTWFSDEWLIGIGMIVASIGGGGFYIYVKLRG